MIDKVEVGKKYRLIDKEGYVSHSKNSYFNRRLVDNKDIFDENLCVVITYVTNGHGRVHGNSVISPNEYHLFALVEENEMDAKEPKTITPETEVTITTTYGELAKAYYVMGMASGKTRGKLLWATAGDLLGDSNRSIYRENPSGQERIVIQYRSVQEEWESLFFKSKEQQEKEIAIEQRRKMIAQLEKEIGELENESHR